MIKTDYNCIYYNYTQYPRLILKDSPSVLYLLAN